MKKHLPLEQKPVNNWNISDVGEWLCQNGLSQYKNLFCDQHKIDGPSLITLTIDDLRQPPVQITVLGKNFPLYIFIMLHIYCYIFGCLANMNL